MTRAWTRSCAACSVRKGLIFLMLCSANLQDRAVFAMCSLKVSWSSKITPRFLTEADGVIVDEPNWIVKSCCRVGVAGNTRSSGFARLSCRWCSFIHAEISARQPEIRAAQIKSNQITFIVTSPQHKCLGEWNSYERAPDNAKKLNKTQQFTYGQYIFTDCTEDNVQKTHTYTQYTQCTIKTYFVINYTLYTVWAHLHYVQYLYIM